MQYSTLIRKKDKGYQYIITYKDNNGKWKTKSKQGFNGNREGKELAKAECEKAVKELKKIIENHVPNEMIGITFEEFAKSYIKHLSLYKETNTILALETVVNRFGKLNKMEMNKIRTIDIQEIVDDMIRERVNPNTITDYLRKLNIFFKSARDEHNLIVTLPNEKIKVTKSKEEIIKRALTKNESEKLLNDFESKLKGRYYLLILISLKCGLRLGESLGLTWNDIDIKNSEIHISRQWKQIGKKKYGFGKLKSKNSFRDVPIPSSILPILKKCKGVDDNDIPIQNKVIPLKKNEDSAIIDKRIFKFNNTDSVSICLNRLFKNGGYNITIHELRHTYATNLIANGIDFKTAARFLGHTVEQTMKTYSHVNDDMVKRATSIINNIL